MKPRAIRSGLTASSTVFVLLISLFAAAAMTPASSRTGDLGNEPVAGYSEGGEIFKIHHASGVHDTSFTLGETVEVEITSDRVKNIVSQNSLKVFDWDNNVLMDMDPAFTVVDSVGPTYSYEASFDASAANGFSNDHYRIEVAIRDNSNKWFRTWDVISVGGGAATPKYIKAFADPDYTSMDWVFNADEVVYLEVWTGGETPGASDSRVEFANYMDDTHGRKLEDLTDPTIAMDGEYARFAYDLAGDLNTKDVDLNEGWWYTLQVELVDDQGADLNVLWTIQIYINEVSDVVDVGAIPASVDVVGTTTTTIYTVFSDPDAPDADAFTISMKLREPDDATEVTLVDARGNGQGGLLITDLGGGEYNATCSWDPPENQAMGLYDISVTILDDEGGQAEDGFNRNPDELNLVNSNFNPPTMVAGNTVAVPAIVSTIGTATTTISSDFEDTDDPAVSSLSVSFWIRDPGGSVLVLADGNAHGDAGKMGGTVTVVKNSANDFTASIEYDPDNTVALGEYDLHFQVVDGDGQAAIDGFDENPNELEITSGQSAPLLGDLVVSPATVDRIGAISVTFTGSFTDVNEHALDQYRITFRVRDPAGDEIDIAKNVQNGEAGEFGDTLTVTRSGTAYTASVDWDPADTVLTGFYDLYMKVEDLAGSEAEADFDGNLDELLITSSSITSTIVLGDTWADPDVVGRTGGHMTLLQATFTDTDEPDADSLMVTFKVRDPNDEEVLLVDERSHGVDGEFGETLELRNEAGTYTASIAWDPDNTATLGSYDLFFSVRDGSGDIGYHPFADNEEELTITDTHEPPTLTAGNVRAVPESVSRDGVNLTTIFAEFRDPNFENLGDFNVTFKVRDEIGDELVLAEGSKNGEVALSGSSVAVTLSSDVFTASIQWDPKDTALIGTYDLYFEVENPTGASVKDDYAHNLDELTVTYADGTSLGNPALDPDTPGASGNDYTFFVIYSDRENDPPDANGVIMVLDDLEYKMTELDATDTNYVDGKKYFLVQTLGQGAHKYHFTATDTTGLNATTEQESLQVAPGGTGDSSADKEDTSTNNMVWLIMLIVIVVVVLMLLIVLLRRKKTNPKDGSGLGEHARKGASIDGAEPQNKAIPMVSKAGEANEQAPAKASSAEPETKGQSEKAGPPKPEAEEPKAPPKAK